MNFEIVGEFHEIETFAVGKGIRELRRLVRVYGPGRWRKRKAIVRIKLPEGIVALAEIHWYEASGIGKKEFKIKRYL